MHRRWFFRVTTLTLLILCLAAWGWSYVYVEVLGYATFDKKIETEICKGSVIIEGRPRNAVYDVVGWQPMFHLYILGSTRESYERYSAAQSLWFHWNDDPFSQRRTLWVPLWSPSILLATLACWAWRKPRVAHARGFAMEKTEQTAAPIDH
jgi:hypothetical protein